ncbi:MAG TPA: hypothetical protein VIE43_19130 [Thermoanaerobaculia bacterium]|jgi:hypothetical protein|nr:hypothetical protein [Thermoanaerobaculia bacterium]
MKITTAILPMVLGWMAFHPSIAPAAQAGPAQLVVVSTLSEGDLGQRTKKIWNLTTDLLGDEDQIRFVFPFTPRPERGFEVTPPLAYGPSDLFRAIRDVSLLAPDVPLRIADAVKFAGYQVAAGRQPRAVLLVLAGNEQDDSRDDVVTVRHLLKVLRVPLYVWSLSEAKPGTTAAAWGAEAITQTWHLASAAGRLRQDLDTQRTARTSGGRQPARPAADTETDR